jgi:probable rRNA maturation factor
VNIIIHNQQSDLSIPVDSVISLVSELLEHKHIQTDEIIFHFVNEIKMQKLHSQYFNDPSSTDCITFPIDDPNERNLEEMHILGEAFICPKSALLYAEQNHLDPFDEISLYIIHCILHLIGFDDTSEQSALIMREEESNCLAYAKRHGLMLQNPLLNRC